MEKNVNDAFDDIYKIEKSLLRREPTIDRWRGYYMANTDKWYYAYTFDGNTVTVKGCDIPGTTFLDSILILFHRSAYSSRTAFRVISRASSTLMVSSSSSSIW